MGSTPWCQLRANTPRFIDLLFQGSALLGNDCESCCFSLSSQNIGENYIYVVADALLSIKTQWQTLKYVALHREFRGVQSLSLVQDIAVFFPHQSPEI
jgi:hypothetical protein